MTNRNKKVIIYKILQLFEFTSEVNPLFNEDYFVKELNDKKQFKLWKNILNQELSLDGFSKKIIDELCYTCIYTYFKNYMIFRKSDSQKMFINLNAHLNKNSLKHDDDLKKLLFYIYNCINELAD